MCGIFVTPLVTRVVKAELRDLKIDIQLYELVLPIVELCVF